LAVEYDYRELKPASARHFEGRSFTGWRRHVTSSCSPKSSPLCCAWTQSGCAGL